MPEPLGSVGDELTGRYVSEARPTWRTEGQRDRDRVLYSAELARLAGVTQVTMAETGLGLHNRLTHTLKVAQYSRRLAERLQSRTAEPSYHALVQVSELDPDVVETAALAHDLGHPPFGHIGEQQLAELMKSDGGFEGNAQSFRIVTRLATGPQASQHQGLNLTRATLNGLLKYPWQRTGDAATAKYGAYNIDGAYFEWARRGWPKLIPDPISPQSQRQKSLEAELMDWADDVTYALHDLEDFHRIGLVPLGLLAYSPFEQAKFRAYIVGGGHRRTQLTDENKGALSDALREISEDYGLRLQGRYDGSLQDRAELRMVVDELLGRFMESIKPRTPTRDNPSLVEIKAADEALVSVLKELTWHYVIERPALASLQIAQRQIISNLFNRFTGAAAAGEWRLFPPSSRESVRDAPSDDVRRRVICDLIASLTDAEAYNFHSRLQGQIAGSVLQQILH